MGAGGAGRGERSSWIAQQQRPHNMASSASSAAGAESTPPLAQVSAARPPYLWLPVRLGRAGNRGAREAGAEGGGVLREPWTRRGAAGSPVLLGVRRGAGKASGGVLIPAGRVGPAAPQGAGLKLRPEVEARARNQRRAGASHPE